MKLLFSLLIVIFCSTAAVFAQQNVKRYVHILIPAEGGPENDIGNKHKIRITLDYGNTKTESAFRDSSISSTLEKVKELKTSVAVLNYMSQIGWSLVHLNSPYVSFNSYEMYFEKEFPATVLALETERVYK